MGAIAGVHPLVPNNPPLHLDVLPNAALANIRGYVCTARVFPASNPDQHVRAAMIGSIQWAEAARQAGVMHVAAGDDREQALARAITDSVDPTNKNTISDLVRCVAARPGCFGTLVKSLRRDTFNANIPNAVHRLTLLKQVTKVAAQEDVTRIMKAIICSTYFQESRPEEDFFVEAMEIATKVCPHILFDDGGPFRLQGADRHHQTMRAVFRYTDFFVAFMHAVSEGAWTPSDDQLLRFMKLCDHCVPEHREPYVVATLIRAQPVQNQELNDRIQRYLDDPQSLFNMSSHVLSALVRNPHTKEQAQAFIENPNLRMETGTVASAVAYGLGKDNGSLASVLMGFVDRDYDQDSIMLLLNTMMQHPDMALFLLLCVNCLNVHDIILDDELLTNLHAAENRREFLQVLLESPEIGHHIPQIVSRVWPNAMTGSPEGLLEMVLIESERRGFDVSRLIRTTLSHSFKGNDKYLGELLSADAEVPMITGEHLNQSLFDVIRNGSLARNVDEDVLRRIVLDPRFVQMLTSRTKMSLMTLCIEHGHLRLLDEMLNNPHIRNMQTILGMIGIIFASIYRVDPVELIEVMIPHLHPIIAGIVRLITSTVRFIITAMMDLASFYLVFAPIYILGCVMENIATAIDVLIYGRLPPPQFHDSFASEMDAFISVYLAVLTNHIHMLRPLLTIL